MFVVLAGSILFTLITLIYTYNDTYYVIPTNSIIHTQHVEHILQWNPNTAPVGKAYAIANERRIAEFVTSYPSPAIKRFINRLKTHHSTFFAVGGSVTAGIDCRQGKFTLKQCSWPKRVADQLNVTLVNVARGATTSQAFYPIIGMMLRETLQPDTNLLVGLDFGANDQREIAEKNDVVQIIQKSHATIIDTIYNHFPDAAIFIMISNPESRSEIVDSVYAILCDQYHIPCIHMHRLGLWLPKFWGRRAHPTFRVHAIMANMVTFMMTRSPMRYDTYPICETPASFYNGTEIGCPYIQDRPGKYAYVCTGDSYIDIPVTFGNHPILVITYLISYEHIGDYEITMNENTTVLSGINTEHVSQYYTRQWYAYQNHHQDGDDFAFGFGVEPNSTHQLVIKRRGRDKIVIRTIISC